MRQNLGEPKTSAVFDEIDEDEIFSNYWNKEHPTDYMILAVTVIMKGRRTSSLMLTFKVFRIPGQPGAEILLHFK